MPSHGVSSSEERAERLFTTDEAGFFFGSLAAARDRFGHVTRAIAREHALGPRGPWIVGLLGRRPISPNELALFFDIGRSLVTSELGQLQDAGLIHYEKSAQDGRRVELSLTPLGQQVRERLSRDLAALLEKRLGGYSKAEVMAAANILRDFAAGHQSGEADM
ncbi:MAG TPA: MarR family winged helix-turn-helix transcriptional regulator [Sphingobium sp.]|uniref:MarR family winged helix-turn-helix transcriptional regulator n=1 Tax=Sphingobium sp. TaxID=1912891 RepID=UPI002ED3F23F